MQLFFWRWRMFERVLIPTDLSLESDKIFDYALNLSGIKEVVAIHSVEASAYELITERKSDEPEEAVSAHGINPSAVEARHMLQGVKGLRKGYSEGWGDFFEGGGKRSLIVDEGNM